MPLRRSYDPPPCPTPSCSNSPASIPSTPPPRPQPSSPARPGRRRPHRNPVRHAHRRHPAVRDCRTPRSATVRWGRPAGPTSTVRNQTSAGARRRLRRPRGGARAQERIRPTASLNEPRTRSRRWSHSPRLPVTLRQPYPSACVPPRVGIRPDLKGPGSMNGAEGFPNLRHCFASRAVALGDSLPMIGKLLVKDAGAVSIPLPFFSHSKSNPTNSTPPYHRHYSLPFSSADHSRICGQCQAQGASMQGEKSSHLPLRPPTSAVSALVQTEHRGDPAAQLNAQSPSLYPPY